MLHNPTRDTAAYMPVYHFYVWLSSSALTIIETVPQTYGNVTFAG